MGLCSDGGVHSHINHLKALIDASSKKKVHTFLHLFLDGRDTAINSGVNFVNEIKDYCKGKPCRIASLCGRAFAMDREKRFDRIQKIYKMLTFGRSEVIESNIDTIFANSYEKEIYDEFFRTTIVSGGYSSIKDGDAVIFFNFRADRARELTDAFTKEDFSEFKVNKYKNLCFTTFTEYDSENKNVNVMFEPIKIENNLSKILADNNLKQLKITETTKYAHVTFFFNGGIEKENVNEDRKLIESEDVLDFSATPKMKAFEVTEEVLLAICDNKYDFILVNLCNADMVGHSGNFEATVKAVEAVDKCAYAIALACLSAGGDCIITADHGNAESMFDKDGNKITSHTTNKVPFLLVSQKHKKAKLKKKGKLSNVAPTVLKLLDIEIPEDMDEPLIKLKETKKKEIETKETTNDEVKEIETKETEIKEEESKNIETSDSEKVETKEVEIKETENAVETNNANAKEVESKEVKNKGKNKKTKASK